jgi:hypothetical protein
MSNAKPNKMFYRTFKDLNVLLEARNFVVDIYKIASSGKLSRDFSLKDHNF